MRTHVLTISSRLKQLGGVHNYYIIGQNYGSSSGLSSSINSTSISSISITSTSTSSRNWRVSLRVLRLLEGPHVLWQ